MGPRFCGDDNEKNEKEDNLLDKTALATTLTAYKAVASNYLSNAAQNLSPFCMNIPLNGTDNINLASLNRVPALSRWIGDRKIHTLGGQSVTYKTNRYQAAVEVDRNDIEYARDGIVRAQLAQLAQRANTHAFKLACDVINNNTILGADGEPLFSDTHPNGKGGYNDNNLSATALTLTGIQTDWPLAKAAMRAFVVGAADPDDTETIDKVPNSVYCPPALESLIRTFFSMDKNAAGTSNNIYKNEVTQDHIYVTSFLTDSGDWFPFYDPSIAGEPNDLKPLALIENRAPQVRIKDEGSENYFDRAAYVYGIDTERIAVPLAYYYMIKIG